ncbi:hypothetical protein BDN70DRAFT_931890 [Pholiota conissans]|uniref:Uncharacterized protein n=1 Tax=Pholiota conissans TaxID=109636 RepID=A0A9P5Z2H4_9AGAR|nr:hypothetical protein BDN70DRAFT_931890 [Pholiota conissans]
MSFSVDDLVSSLNSSHIGQEARDLAALQAQLAETLFGANAGSTSTGGGHQMHIQIPARGRPQHTQPCNTPLARTPSSSISGWNMYAEHKRNSSVSSSHYHDEMEEDERMVEELLLPSSPYPGNHTASSSSNYSSPYYSSSAYQSPPPQTPSSAYASPTFTEPPPPSPSASLFTTTDPFYIAQAQASQAFSNNANVNFSNAQQQQQQQSGFAQNGRLSQSSPFALAPQYHQYSHGQNWGDVTSFKPCATTAF